MTKQAQQEQKVPTCDGCFSRDNAISAMRSTRNDMQRRIRELEGALEMLLDYPNDPEVREDARNALGL